MKLTHNPTPHVTKPQPPKNKKETTKPFSPFSPLPPLNSLAKTVFGQLTQKDDQNKQRSWLV